MVEGTGDARRRSPTWSVVEPKTTVPVYRLSVPADELQQFGAPADAQHEDAGRVGIECAGVPHLAGPKSASDLVDDVVAGAAGGFVDDQHAADTGVAPTALPSGSCATRSSTSTSGADRPRSDRDPGMR